MSDQNFSFRLGKLTSLFIALSVLVLLGGAFSPAYAYTVTFKAGAGGTLSGVTTQTVSQSDTTSGVTATPNSGYKLVSWSSTGTGTYSVVTTNPLVVKDVTADTTFTANFELISRIINLTGSLAFEYVSVNSSRQMTLTISNTGNSTLNISSISYPDGYTGDWSSGKIAASTSKDIIVTFKPAAAQTYSGTVTVNSDKTSGTDTIAISGTGVTGTRIIGLSGNLAFGNVGVNSVKNLTLTISNTGTSALTVSSISYPTDFTGSWSGTIAAGGSQNVTVTFKPTAVQSYSGTVTVNSDKTSGTNTTAISGTGVQGSVSYSGSVKDLSGNGISGVTLTFSNSGGTATTDSSGNYSKTFTAAWSGMVTPSKSGYGFSPSSRSYSNVTTNQSDQNYTGGVPPAAVRIWIDKNGSGSYDSGEEVSGASVRVNTETTDRGITDANGIVQISNITGDTKFYAEKRYYSMSNPKAVNSNFNNSQSKNPYYAGSVDGKAYNFVMASDIMAADGTYYDFPGQNKTLINATRDAQGNILIQLIHPKIGWNLVLAFEEAQSAEYIESIKAGFRNYADYMYNYTDGYFTVKNVVLVKNAYKDTPQWNYADVQVKNSDWPNAHIFGNRNNRQTHIHMSKYFDGSGVTSGDPSSYNWYSTVGHESGHYLLGFYDEYLNGSKNKVSNGTWTYRISHDGDTGEPNEFPKNYGLMESQYNGIHEMSDLTEYFSHNYSSADIVTNQFYLRTGQSCWTYFSSYYQNDIKAQMTGQGFSDAFFNKLIIPPHTSGSYPGSDRTKRNGPEKMNRDTVNFIEWNYASTRSTRQSENVFDASALVLDEAGTPLAGAGVWLVSSDRRSFQGKSDKNGMVKCGSLLIGKRLEAYLDGRKAEVVIDAVKERYVLMFPANRIDLRDDLSSGMVITAKPDSANPKRLTIAASGNLLSAAPSVTLSQSHGYSVSVPMTASGADQFSGIADCQYDSGILHGSSGATQSVSPFEIFSTELGPASGYYAPNGELEMVYGSDSFTGTGSFVILNSSMPVPINSGKVVVGNVYSFGFSYNVTPPARNVVFNIRLPESGKGSNPNLYGWNIQNKTWVLIPGGTSDRKFFSISLASLDYPAYALFEIPQENDPYPPNPVTGFTVSTGNSLWNVNLQWTAPGDNAGVFAYDVRFNTVPVTEENWDDCISVGNVPEPTSPGTVQSFAAEMPDPGVSYYFGIKVIDESGNTSTLTSFSAPIRSYAKSTAGDGIPDIWKLVHGLDPNVNYAQNDNDGDGLTNIQEYQNRTNPEHSDTDGDGYSDGDEIGMGSDPNDPQSYVNLSSAIPGDLDCDENVTLSDAIIALRIISGIDPPPIFCKNDVNGDNKIGIEEVIYILQKVAGLR